MIILTEPMAPVVLGTSGCSVWNCCTRGGHARTRRDAERILFFRPRPSEIARRFFPMSRELLIEEMMRHSASDRLAGICLIIAETRRWIYFEAEKLTIGRETQVDTGKHQTE